jgi:superfamily I DNA and/or RNA helicase
VCLPGFKFDAVIIDEAAQAVEPSSLIPFKYNPQAVVMVGDPCQLPATVFSNSAKRCNFGQSLFQRLHISGSNISHFVMLVSC